MNPLFDTLVAFYSTIDWPMSQVPGQTILSTTYSGQQQQWVFVASSDEAHQAIVMFSRAPLECPEDRIHEVLRLFNHANFAITMGAWVLDPGDGEIRFRVGIDVHDVPVTPELLRRLTLYTVMTMEHYLPGLQGLLSGELDAEEAWTRIFPERRGE